MRFSSPVFRALTTALLLLLLQAWNVSSDVNLPFGDVNIVVLTDVHSWVAGHSMHEPHLDATYGDILSFYERLKELEADRDIFFVMNGDFMDGTGLSTYPPTHLTPILRFMPWDAANIGNHELYRNETVQHMVEDGGFVEHWNGNYLTTNVLLEATREPIGSRFTYLKGKHLQSSILTFGFLYDFQHNCNLTIVEPVEEVVQADWFVSELQQGDFDAILVLAHMDVKDPLVYVILDAIRDIVGDEMPVQFITGHTHFRLYEELDDRASSFEPGRYLDTLGFVSFPIQQNLTTNQTADFRHVFLDANVQTLKDTLGMDDMSTSSGSALSSLIHETRRTLGLLQVVGCSSQSYYLLNGLEERQSLWALYMYQVVMRGFFHFNQSSVLIQNTESFRYDLLEGNVTRDDVIAVSPYNDSIQIISQDTLGADLLLLLDGLNSNDNQNSTTTPLSKLPAWAISGAILPEQHYDVFTEAFAVPILLEALVNITGESSFEPVPVYHEDGRVVTTTSLWLDYVSNYWACDKPTAYTGMNRWMFVAFSVAAALVFFGWRYYWRSRRHARQGYDNAVAIEEEDDDDVEGIL